MRKLKLAALLAGAVGACSFSAARADTLVGNFDILNGSPTGLAAGGEITFTLNGDGTIAADLKSADGSSILGFGFDSAVPLLPESSFSVPVGDTHGWTDVYGYQPSGFTSGTNRPTSETWTIGVPTEFTSVFQALGGSSASYDFFLYTSNGDQWAANANAVAATPLPAALPLFATALGGLGLLGWRRKRKVQFA